MGLRCLLLGKFGLRFKDLSSIEIQMRMGRRMNLLFPYSEMDILPPKLVRYRMIRTANGSLTQLSKLLPSYA